MTIQENNIVGQVVAQDYRTASVFQSYGIDFCCRGNRTIASVCESKNIPVSEVLEKLNATLAEQDESAADYQSWDPDLLVDYIEKKHHRYVEEKILEIPPYLQKVAKVHGERHPELYEIETLFNAAVGELAKHMKKEELVLFPYVRKMVKARQQGQVAAAPHFGTVQNPIQMMMHEHDTEGERFRKIAKLSNNYTPPEDACTTYRVVFALLRDFEADLHLHIHLENNILFPKAIEMERTLHPVE